VAEQAHLDGQNALSDVFSASRCNKQQFIDEKPQPRSVSGS
jgi:hypothetical protein